MDCSTYPELAKVQGVTRVRHDWDTSRDKLERWDRLTEKRIQNTVRLMVFIMTELVAPEYGALPSH